MLLPWLRYENCLNRNTQILIKSLSHNSYLIYYPLLVPSIVKLINQYIMFLGKFYIFLMCESYFMFIHIYKHINLEMMT